MKCGMIFINDLPDGLSSTVKLFAHKTYPFPVVHDIHSSARDLNKGIKL